MMNYLTIQCTKDKRRAAIFFLLLMGVFSFLANAADLPKLTDSENARSRQWLEQNQTSLSESVLMKALISYHYRPSLSLLPFLGGELTDKQRRIILSLMISQCANYSKFVHCDGALLENELVELNPKNLFPYLLQFNYFIAKGDINNALVSLKKGLTTTEVDDYFFDKVMYLRSELGAIEIRGGRANLAAELYSGNGLLQTYTEIRPACTEYSKTSHEWEFVCLLLSRKLEQGTTFLANVVGAALQRDVLIATAADEKKIQAALKHRAFYNDFRADLSSKLPGWNDSTQRADSYYNNAVQLGELQASKIMLNEVSNTLVK